MLSIKLEPEEENSSVEELLDSGDSDDFDPLPHQMAGSPNKFDLISLAILGK